MAVYQIRNKARIVDSEMITVVTMRSFVAETFSDCRKIKHLMNFGKTM